MLSMSVIDLSWKSEIMWIPNNFPSIIYTHLNTQVSALILKVLDNNELRRILSWLGTNNLKYLPWLFIIEHRYW